MAATETADTREVPSEMDTIGAGRIAGRRGRPLVYSLTETMVFVLIAIALIATAAVPAIARHPHTVQAKTLSASAVRP